MAGHIWSFFAYCICISSHKYQIIQPNSNSLTKDPKQKYCAFMLSQNVLFHCLNSSLLHSKAKKQKIPQPHQLNSYCYIVPGGHLQAEIGNDRTASAALESGQSFTCHFPSSGHFLHYHFGRTSGPKQGLSICQSFTPIITGWLN